MRVLCSNLLRPCWLVGLLSLLGLSCTHWTKVSPLTIQTPFVYPNARFELEGKSCLLSDALNLKVRLPDIHPNSSRITLEQLRQFCRDAGQPPEHFNKMIADPFIAQPALFVRFGAADPGEKIAAYYTKLFENAGWQVRRGSFVLEYTSQSHDWLRVYRRDNQEILLHLDGPWNADAKSNNAHCLITFKFRGLTPMELFGDGYKKAASQRQR